jgi:hypothetical protein
MSKAQHRYTEMTQSQVFLPLHSISSWAFLTLRVLLLTTAGTKMKVSNFGGVDNF